MTDVIQFQKSAKVSSPADVRVADYIAFERLLADLSARFANVPGEQLIQEVEAAQMRLLRFLGFDRCSYGEYTDDGVANVQCSVAVNGVQPFPSGPVPAVFDWYVNELRSGRNVILRSLEDAPAEAGGMIDMFRRSGLRSHIGIPIFVGGRFVGGIGFAAFRATRSWPEDLIARLKLIGEVFAQAFARKHATDQLVAAYAEIKQLKARLEEENTYLRQAGQNAPFHGLVTRSPHFKTVIDEVTQVAPSGATVFLLGETGSGKEVLAQAIHDASSRRHRPMVKVNCAALPPTLIEAELFGREKGAYTGALARQGGRFEIAHGSTIFLDEVGELPLELQPKLLRVLQEGEFERVGGTQTIKVDARVIAASNRDIAAAVRSGGFREDLFYRLNVFPIEVPPLRARREDIPTLAWSFVKEFSRSMGKPIDQIADASMAAMQAYSWPGNVRELRNAIERAMILAHGSTLHVTLSRNNIHLEAPRSGRNTLEEFERAHIKQALELSGWRVRGPRGAAALLGVKPTTLESRMKKLGVTRPL